MAYEYPDPEEAARTAKLPKISLTDRSNSSGHRESSQSKRQLSGSSNDSEDGDPVQPNDESPEPPRSRLAKSQIQHASLRAYQNGDELKRGRRGGLGRGHKGVKRGLRNPVEPAIEFKALHSEATMAFIAKDFERAELLTLQALQVNPEMYEAHSLLSEIHSVRGDTDKALAAAWNGAHTRPRDVKTWSKVARLVLERDEQHKPPTLRDAIYCYTRIIAVDSRSFEARFQRAVLNRELGYPKKAVSEYEQILKLAPHDSTALRLLAEVCIETDQPEKALTHYQAAIDFAQENESDEVTDFTWSDVNIIAELHGFQQEYSAGVIQIKRLSRWLLGRTDEEFWEYYDGEDREWDAEDQPRRTSTPEFIVGEHDLTAYGYGLPLELRVKLGIFRLKANPDDNEEAMVGIIAFFAKKDWG